VKKIWFTASFPKRAIRCHYIDLRTESTSPSPQFSGLANKVDLDPIFALNEDVWKRAFIEKVGAINMRNASLEWWAHGTSSKKSFLVPQAGNRFFEVLAICHVLESHHFDQLIIIGATPAQVDSVSSWLNQQGHNRTILLIDQLQRWSVKIQILLTPFRIALQVWRALSIILLRQKRPFIGPIDLCLFTFVDHNFHGNTDQFFGTLGAHLTKARPEARIAHVAYLQGPQNALLKKMRQVGETYWPLFCELKLADLLWALKKTCLALFFRKWDLGTTVDPRLKPLLEASIQWDLAEGAHLNHLLAYRAAQRFAAAVCPARVAYPYENKALERMLITGLRTGYKNCETIGYQHTSITPRHTTLLFASGESEITPLPDRIWTVGDITKSYLENHGKYPQDIFETACALRQNTAFVATKSIKFEDRPKILLALSSSKFELLRAVNFFKALYEVGEEFTLGIRPHPDFPLTLLPGDFLSWIKTETIDLTGTNLNDNIEWCDLTAYVSSTVALEALFAGKPVVNIAIGDPITPDPLLGNPPFRWHAKNPTEFNQAIHQIASLKRHELDDEISIAHQYAMRYLHEFSPACAEKFLAPIRKTK
jgi:hypothetical protein